MSDQHAAGQTTAPTFTVETAKVLAEVAHNRQKDKLKRPYKDHVLAVKNDGTVWGFGGNEYNQLGDGHSQFNSQPVPALLACP